MIETIAPGGEVEIVLEERGIARLVRAPAIPRRPGSAKGSILDMAPDFDAPLEEFRDYME